MTNMRSIRAVVPSVPTVEGGGFPVRRPLPTQSLPLVDPFLLDEVALLRVLGDQMTLAPQLCRLAQEAQSAATQTAVLSERNRLARDLHDTLAQGSTG